MPPGSPTFTVRYGVLFRLLADGREIAHTEFLKLSRRERLRLDQAPDPNPDSAGASGFDSPKFSSVCGVRN